MGKFSDRLNKRMNGSKLTPVPSRTGNVKTIVSKDPNFETTEPISRRSYMADNPKYLSGLFLDDERKPSEATWMCYGDYINWQIVKNDEEFYAAIEKNVYDVYSFDWYLGGRSGSVNGFDVLKEFCQRLLKNPPKELPQVHAHSSDHTWRRQMDRYWYGILDTLEELTAVK